MPRPYVGTVGTSQCSEPSVSLSLCFSHTRSLKRWILGLEVERIGQRGCTATGSGRNGDETLVSLQSTLMTVDCMMTDSF